MMALKLSKNAGLTDIVSFNQKPFIRRSDSVQIDYHEIPNYPENPDMSIYDRNPAYNPIVTEHNVTGGADTVRLWLFNDQTAKRYEGISVQPQDLIGSDESAWVQLAPDNAGNAGTFLAGGAALAFPDVNDANVGKPFWVKVTTPAVSDTQNKTDIKLLVTGKEYAV